ncbi:MAG: hypothetical protein A2808_03325 [Candidatus Moranbacteria bacterium RIFCSPHIGHO2_01_FULL_55_24]|nr:MAG: hypothetical protein A2808_03325 [Candidatus Moranbacteria bacterium RIFCSPHIGHO2_01_FULL_55_24]
MLNIPFYKNLKTDTHCVQASYKMVLKYVFPEKDFSYAFLDKKTYHKKDKWTWNAGGLLFLASLGFEVKNIEKFDYKQLVQFGVRYLKHIWDDETFRVQKQYSDFNQEIRLAKKLLASKSIQVLNRKTSLEEIEKLFKSGYILLASVNPAVFQRRKFYAKHLVVITGMTDKSIRFHDPGLPPMKNRRVLKATFMRAMGNFPEVVALRHPRMKRSL